MGAKIVTAGSCQLCGAIMQYRHEAALPRNAIASHFAMETLKHLATAHTKTTEGVATGPANDLTGLMTMLTEYFSLSFVITTDPGLVEQRRRLGEVVFSRLANITQRIAKDRLTTQPATAHTNPHG